MVEKSGNLIEHDHFTTDGQLVYSDDNVVKIVDTGDRGYGKSVEDVVKPKEDKPQTYFKYYEYVEKKPATIVTEIKK